MEVLISAVKWLFFGSIYGLLVLAGLVYAAAAAIRAVFPKAPHPAVVAVGAYFVGLATLPSVPRYQFERETLAKIEGKEWIRVVDKARWGAVEEPLTWFRAPIGSMLLVMPNDPLTGGFQEVLLQYEKKPRVRFVEPDCNAQTLRYSAPDESGVMRYQTTDDVRMEQDEEEIYCAYDWSKERAALLASMVAQWPT